MKMIWLLLLVVAATFSGLRAWRALDHRSDLSAWQSLASREAKELRLFDLAMVEDLPEPARRYFAFTIAPGTPLHTVAEIDMVGTLDNGSREAPNPMPMEAKQILAPPFGLVWRVRFGKLSGSDGATPSTSWTRFWLLNTVPVVRASGPDHHRSSFGRVIAETAFWSPASLLPGPGVRWEAVDRDRARAIVTYGSFQQAVEITVDPEGAPTKVLIKRWSDANTEGEFREQPFGGFLSEYRSFDGYRLPTRVEGGNLIGTPEYFAFFRAEVSDIRLGETSIRGTK
ncbi:hypothetical protein HK107_14440 [Parvularcula sp. ZS-1/3]|uniref:Uncharacterized protein n=1 Tax=Parvularcula mediterranea TaxID=2732508 RepID=A0A7Y3W6H0_9PROT|nr:DUF6544 family protein [Parvularcula mediterranea]NNU17528.1 hypothetical protein [Parvularcula mediterranea]